MSKRGPKPAHFPLDCEDDDDEGQALERSWLCSTYEGIVQQPEMT